MSIELQNMTLLQRQIVESLANDLENLGHIREFSPAGTSEDQLYEALKVLIADGIVICYASSEKELIPVPTPNYTSLSQYWFGLSERGEQLLRAMEV